MVPVCELRLNGFHLTLVVRRPVSEMHLGKWADWHPALSTQQLIKQALICTKEMSQNTPDNVGPLHRYVPKDGPPLYLNSFIMMFL